MAEQRRPGQHRRHRREQCKHPKRNDMTSSKHVTDLLAAEDAGRARPLTSAGAAMTEWTRACTIDDLLHRDVPEGRRVSSGMPAAGLQGAAPDGREAARFGLAA